MEVAQEDGGLGAGDDQNEVDHAEKAEHVVELMRPQAVEDEEELNEDAAEGQDAAHDNAWQRASVQILDGDLTRDLVGAHGVLNHGLLEAQVRAQEHEWCAHAEPQSEQSDQCAEWYGRRALVYPQNQVEHKENDKHNSEITNKESIEFFVIKLTFLFLKKKSNQTGKMYYPGHRKAVLKTLMAHFSPPNILYMRAEM